MKITFIVMAIVLSLITSVAFSGGNHAHKHDHGHGGNNSSVVGKPGDLKNVSRTIKLQMTYKHFKPSRINVKKGETIKFVLKNVSEKEHEIMIGTIEELKEHAKTMRKNPDWVHVDPNQVTVEAGKTGEMIWQFTEAGTIPFACPRHGHFKAMRGEITVADK
jgi:uncharacterized cupredoxin-like copper-binding protein